MGTKAKPLTIYSPVVLAALLSLLPTEPPRPRAIVPRYNSGTSIRSGRVNVNGSDESDEGLNPNRYPLSLDDIAKIAKVIAVVREQLPTMTPDHLQQPVKTAA
jgi:hypothetical protein